MPPPKEGRRHRRRPPVSYRQSDDDLDYDGDDLDYDDVDLDDDDEVAGGPGQRSPTTGAERAARARYRARYPDRVATARKLYRARYPDKVAAARRRYRKKYRAKVLEAQRRYYYTHLEQRRAYDKQRRQSEHRRAWMAQYRAKMREASALARKTEQDKSYAARYRERWRTSEKIKALGPLKLTVTLEDFMQDFCDSLESSETSSTQEGRCLGSMEKDLVPREDAMTVMDMDSGDLHALDHSAWDGSSPSSSFCDMLPDDGGRFLDDLLEELSELSSSSDDSLYGLLSDMSPDEGAQLGEDLSFDLDDFVS